MRVAVTGGTGIVGRFVVERLLFEGHEVISLSRRPTSARGPEGGAGHRVFDLARPEDAPLEGAEALVHAALDHAPGRYRGGEGEDAAGFLSRNLGGTIQLFRAARRMGVSRIVFLSSRAVYGDHPPGTALHEDLPARPDTLYGHVKREAEIALARLDGSFGTSLRITGVYGPPPPEGEHKWSALFRAYAAGDAVPPRIGTEVHGADVAAAVALCLGGPPRPGIFNVSDFVLDRADLLEEFGRRAGVVGRLPRRSDPGGVNAMPIDRLRSLGWRPKGRTGLSAALEEMAQRWRQAGGKK